MGRNVDQKVSSVAQTEHIPRQDDVEKMYAESRRIGADNPKDALNTLSRNCKQISVTPYTTMLETTSTSG